MNLRALHKRSDKKWIIVNIKALLMLNTCNYSYGQIADILMVDDSTICRWYVVFESDGIDVLLKYNYLGSDGKLTKNQIA